MSPLIRRENQKVLDAITQFRQAKSQEELWQSANQQLADFGIGGILYGSELIHEGRNRLRDRKTTTMLSSLAPAYIELKMDTMVIDDDYYYKMAKAGTNPIFWSDLPQPNANSPEELRQFEIDCDYGVLTGITLPSRFGGGLGISAVSCHAPNMSWGEFDRLWAEKGGTIQGIACAFDTSLRESHMREIYHLSERERECLLWLAAGLRQQQIAFKLNTSVKTVEKQIESARRKLKASTVPQAITTAVVFNLLTP
ncbi:helix-turn-helix transcriptional regulator [Paramagnetospirillum caucaseum]|uniref:helix-turn-helix transcriptional regulator n=1 Tax=Paramagnetospirillum caucaseum TaxID=1244869 RepID=UPI0013775388|nr:LuxR family transcriptional regulator [Paramagnetospirillum caucaseum]